jgi:hypothetical protein
MEIETAAAGPAVNGFAGSTRSSSNRRTENRLHCTMALRLVLTEYIPNAEFVLGSDCELSVITHERIAIGLFALPGGPGGISDSSLWAGKVITPWGICVIDVNEAFERPTFTYAPNMWFGKARALSF